MRNTIKQNKKTLFLHIGFGKTGTTSIQNALYNNRSVLIRQGILYPKTGIRTETHDFGHHEVAACVDTVRESEYYWSILMEQQQDNAHTIVLSSEGFVRPSDNLVAFAKEFDQVRIILYVREQISLIESVYLTHQVMGATFEHLRSFTKCGYFSSIEEFIERSQDMFNFCNYIRPWESVFGRDAMRVRLYLPRSYSFDVLDDFLALLPVDIKKIIKPTDKLNISLISDFSEILLLLDQQFVFKYTEPHTRRQVVESLLRLSEQFRTHSKGSLISSELATELRSSYKESNEIFARNYLTPEEAELLLR